MALCLASPTASRQHRKRQLAQGLSPPSSPLDHLLLLEAEVQLVGRPVALPPELGDGVVGVAALQGLDALQQRGRGAGGGDGGSRGRRRAAAAAFSVGHTEHAAGPADTDPAMHTSPMLSG